MRNDNVSIHCRRSANISRRGRTTSWWVKVTTAGDLDVVVQQTKPQNKHISPAAALTQNHVSRNVCVVDSLKILF